MAIAKMLFLPSSEMANFHSKGAVGLPGNGIIDVHLWVASSPKEALHFGTYSGQAFLFSMTEAACTSPRVEKAFLPQTGKQHRRCLLL